MTIREQLQAKNVNTRQFDDKQNASKLFSAIESRNLDEIRGLVNNGVDINTKDEYGETALIHATDNADKKIVRLLIEFGTDINSQDDEGWTALIHAIFIKSIEIAKLLIKNGADVNIKDNNGQTPLMIAADFNAKEIGELLILEGADIDVVDNQGMTAFDIARKKWLFKKNDFFLKTRQPQSKINKARIDYLLNTLHFFEEFGNIVDIKTEFQKKYEYGINSSDLNEYIRTFNKMNTSKLIRKLTDKSVQIVLNYKAIEKELQDEFDKKNYGYIVDIKSKFFNSYVYELEDAVLDRIIETFNKINNSKLIRKLNNNAVQIVPNDKVVEKFLQDEFDNKNYGYIVDIKSKFFNSYGCELEDAFLEKFIKIFNDSKGDKILITDSNRILVLQDKLEVQKSLSLLFKNQLGIINNKEEINKVYCAKCNTNDIFLQEMVNNFYVRSFFYKIIKITNSNYTILPNDLMVTNLLTEKFLETNSYINFLQSNIYSREFKNNLTTCLKLQEKFHQGLAVLIQCKFLNECVGYSCSINELIKFVEDEYSISSIKREDIISSVQIANQNLKDIKIIENDDTLKSSFKGTNMNSDNIDVNICPVCGKNFDELNSTQIKTHILELHTSQNSYCSILEKKTNSDFFCNQCKKRHLALYNNEVRYQAIYHHLFGLCKNPSPPKSARMSNILDKGIYKGFSYANDSSFLGNSGQLLRDNGRFGSYPIEDNYD